MTRFPCKKCGNKVKAIILNFKDGSRVVEHPDLCRSCEFARTHEIIARVAMDYGKQ